MARAVDWSDPSVIGGLLPRLGFQRYAEYLASPHWRDVKRRYRASNRPQRCVCGAAGSQLHHLTYQRLGAERLTDLELLCEVCHRRVHDVGPKRRPAKKRKPSRAMLSAPLDRLSEPHLRSLPGAVRIPQQKPPKGGFHKKRGSNLKRGEPKPWEWDARPQKRDAGGGARRDRRRR